MQIHNLETKITRSNGKLNPFIFDYVWQDRTYGMIIHAETKEDAIERFECMKQAVYSGELTLIEGI